MKYWRGQQRGPVDVATQEQKVEEIVQEWARKKFAFLPGFPDSRIPALLFIRDRGGQLSLLAPSEAQRAYAETRSSRNIVLKARQVGMTTYIAARYLLSTVLVPGTVTLQVAHSLESAQQIFRIVHRFYEHLPEKYRHRLRIVRSNVRELAFGVMDSRYIVDTAGNPNAGRGLTIHNLHASEVALWPGDPQETMAALLAAVPPGGSVDIESTPHGAGGYFHGEWLRAKAGEGFTPHFFPWWIERAYQLPLLDRETMEPFEAVEASLIERYRLTHEHIKYRRQIRRQFGARAAQEYAETDIECFLLSGRPVFEVDAIEARLRTLHEPIRTSQNGEERVWFEPERGHDYVIGADVAEGKARGDFSATVVLDTQTGLQCAELLTHASMHEFAAQLARLGKQYNTALLVVERNNHGHAVLEALQHSHAYPRIYFHAARHSSARAGGGGSADNASAGWPTTELTKPQAIAALDRMLREAPHVFQSRRLLEQCRGYSCLEGGGTGALPGMHDDLVMAAAIACAVRASARPVELFALQR